MAAIATKNTREKKAFSLSLSHPFPHLEQKKNPGLIREAAAAEKEEGGSFCNLFSLFCGEGKRGGVSAF